MMRFWRRGLLVLLGLALLAVAGGYGYLRSADFASRLQNYVVDQITQATHTSATLGGFHFSLHPLALDLDNLTLRGREAADQPPLARVAHLHLELRLVSLLHRKVLLQALVAEQPDIHIYRLADGGLNLPRVASPATQATTSTQALFNLGVRTLQFAHGQLQLEERALTLDFTLRDVDLELAAQPATGAFLGKARYTSADLHYDGWLPLHPTTDLAFVLQGNELRLEHCLIAAGGAQVALLGTIQPLTQPVFDGTYTLDLNLPEWAHTTHLTGLAAGTLRAAGAARWSSQDSTAWRVSGKLSGSGIRLSAPAGQAWQAAGTFAAAPAGLTLAQLDLTGMGAHVAVHGVYNHWSALDLLGQMNGLRLSSLTPVLANAGLDARATTALAGLESSLAGSFHLSARGVWSDRRHDVLDLDASLTPPPVPGGATAVAPGKLPLRGTVRARYSAADAALTLTALDLALPASHLTAHGQLALGAAQAGQVQLDFATTDAAELRPLLPLPAGLPDWNAAGTVRGTLAGALTAPVFSGEVALTNAHWADYHADALAVAGRIAADGATLTSATLRTQAQQANLSGTVGLSDYRLAPTSRLRLSLQAVNLDLGRLQTVAGLHYPIAGLASVRATVAGTRAHPSGSGQVRITQAQWENQTVRSLSADFQVANDVLTTGDLTLTMARTRITGQLRAGLNDKTYQLDVASPSVQLNEIAWLQSSRLAVQGTAQFHLTGQGVWTAPQADLTFITTGLRGGGESLGTVQAQAHLGQGSATFNASATLPNGSLALSGTAGMAAPYPVNAHLALRDYDFDAFLRRFTPAELSGHSSMSGTATITGPLDDPAQLNAQIALDPVEVALSGVALHNQGPITIEIANQELRLLPAHVVAAGNDYTDFTVSGRAALAPGTASRATIFGGALQAQLDGSINLALLHDLHPATHATGKIQIAARLGGSLAQPQMSGSVTVHGGAVTEEGFPIGFDTIEGQFRLAGTRVQVEKLTANTGGGSLSVTGFAGRASNGWNFDLNALGQNLRVRYQGISTTGDVQLRLSGQRGVATLAGNAQLNRIALSPDFDLAIFIATSQTDAGSNDTSSLTDSLLNRVHLDVHLVTGPQVELATNLGHVQLQGDLRLHGTLANPTVLGRASGSEGTVLFAGNTYQVDKAQVQFVNPFRIEPVLDIGLSTTVQQYDVTLNISGPVDKLLIRYRSNPPLADSDIVALLATGAPTQASAALNQSATNSFAGQSEQLLGTALDNIVASRLQRLFGITQVQVNPNTGIAGATGSGSTVTIQQQVSRDVKITYTQNLTTSSQDILQLDWTLSRKLGVTFSRDQFGLYGVEFTLRQRKH